MYVRTSTEHYNDVQTPDTLKLFHRPRSVGDAARVEGLPEEQRGGIKMADPFDGLLFTVMLQGNL